MVLSPAAALAGPVALLFPGQGVQQAGMGRRLAAFSTAADRALTRAQEVLDMPVRRLCFEGPLPELLRTENLQPCLLAVSWAAFECFSERFSMDEVKVVAGHSMGEISACAAADAVSWEQALLLVRERGRLMADCALARPGRMLAVVGLSERQVEAIRVRAQAAGGIWLANVNSKDQFILSGEPQAVAAAERLAQEAGARRVVVLDVPLGAHSPLMERASARLSEIVRALPLHPPSIPLVANGTGHLLRTASSLRSELTGHLL
ncbi:MAG: ACP S-malonyltransferase, partial [Candidatus Dormibacteria bacterium]